MREFLSIVGPLLAAASFIPYLKETISGKVRPRVASWATWSLVTGVATIAEIVHHDYTSAFLTGIATVVELAILIMAIRRGDYDYGWVDGISQAISLFGLVAWLISSDPVYAIIFNIVADLCGVVPTLYHSWISPHEESWKPFIGSGFGAAVSFLAVKHVGFVSAGFPIYLALVGFVIGLNIYYRQQVVKVKTEPPAPEMHNHLP